MQDDKEQFHWQHGPPLAVVFAVAYHWHLAIFGASGCLMLEGAAVKSLGALYFQVQKRKVGDGYVSGIVALVVLMVAGALGVKAKLVFGNVGHLALANLAFSACIHGFSKL